MLEMLLLLNGDLLMQSLTRLKQSFLALMKKDRIKYINYQTIMRFGRLNIWQMLYKSSQKSSHYEILSVKFCSIMKFGHSNIWQTLYKSSQSCSHYEIMSVKFCSIKKFGHLNIWQMLYISSQNFHQSICFQ